MSPSFTDDSAVATVPVVIKASNASASLPTATRHEEYQYLDLIKEILETGEHRPDR